MELTLFIKTLITQGKVSVQENLEKTTPADVTATKNLLQQYYADDILKVPFSLLFHTMKKSLFELLNIFISRFS